MAIGGLTLYRDTSGPRATGQLHVEIRAMNTQDSITTDGALAEIENGLDQFDALLADRRLPRSPMSTGSRSSTSMITRPAACGLPRSGRIGPGRGMRASTRAHNCRSALGVRSRIRHYACVEIEVLFAGVAVRDLDMALPWYELLFGRAPDIVPNDDEVMWHVSTAGWVCVVRDNERAGRGLVTLCVRDLDAFVAEAADRGASGEPIVPVGDAGRKATHHDPEGNLIAFIEVAAATQS